MATTRTKKPPWADGGHRDLVEHTTVLPPDERCDPHDVFSHDWDETEPWHGQGGAVGEFRIVTCSVCHKSMTEGRPVDPDDPAPVVEHSAPELTEGDDDDAE